MPRLLIAEPAQPVSSPNATPDVFGAGVGQAAQQTGRVAQALGQVLGEYSESRARASAVRYEQELQGEADRISLDPDIEGRGEKFEAAQRRAYTKYRPKLGGHGTYDDRTAMATLDLRTKFTGQTMRDGIAEARRNTGIEVQHKMMQAANSDSDEEVGALFNEAQLALQDGSLYMTPAQQTIALQDAIGTGLRAMSDTNPKRALKFIDKLGEMLDPEVISVYRGQAMTNIRQAAALEVANAKEERRLRLANESDASLAAEERLIAIDAKGTLTIGDVKAEVDSLSPAAYKRMKSLATGGSGSQSSDPDTYIELSDRAYSGEDVVEDANAAMSDGRLNRTERDAIVKTSRDGRFKENRDAINKALDPGIYTTDTQIRAKRVRALQSFDRWARENPDSTFEEAQGKADAIIDAASTKLRKPTFLGRTITSQEDIDTHLENTQKQADQGIIDQDEASARYEQLRQIGIELEARAAIANQQGAE